MIPCMSVWSTEVQNDSTAPFQIFISDWLAWKVKGQSAGQNNVTQSSALLGKPSNMNEHDTDIQIKQSFSLNVYYVYVKKSVQGRKYFKTYWK